jgi:hypothetical protein
MRPPTTPPTPEEINKKSRALWDETNKKLENATPEHFSVAAELQKLQSGRGIELKRVLGVEEMVLVLKKSTDEKQKRIGKQGPISRKKAPDALEEGILDILGFYPNAKAPEIWSRLKQRDDDRLSFECTDKDEICEVRDPDRPRRDGTSSRKVGFVSFSTTLSRIRKKHLKQQPVTV